MKKVILLLLISVLGYRSYAQCSVDGVTETILVNGVEGRPVCYGTQVSTKLTNLEDGVTYTITYPGFTQSKQYWSDGSFTSITWSFGTLTQSVTYTITGRADGCSQLETLIDNTINVSSTAPTVTLNASADDPSHVCANSTITLTVTGTAGLTYTWHTNPAIDQQIHGTSFSPTQPAEYWVTAVAACWPSPVESEHIAVDFVPLVSTPVITATSGPHCIGPGTSTYTATATDATSYTWAITGAGNSTISSSGVVTWDPNFYGTPQISVTAYGCGGSSATSQTSITASRIAPATLSGGGSTCSGVAMPLTLTSDAATLDDVWYSLFLNGNFVSQQRGYDNVNDRPVSSITWNQSNVGRYTVTATGNGCANIPMEGSAIIIIISPATLLLTPSGDPQRACANDGFNLAASNTKNLNITYTWHSLSTPPVDSPMRGNPFVPDQSATYWVTATVDCGVVQESDHIGVTINQPPDVSLTPSSETKICSYCTQTINASSQATNSYQWRKDGANIPDATSSSFTANQSGVYSVLATSAAGCTNEPSVLLTVNMPPAVSVSNQTLTLPTNSTTLTANASDPDGTIVSYLWTQLSGGGITTSGELTNSLALSELHADSYQFQISVRDDFGEMKNFTVTVQVNAPPNNYNYLRESSILISGKTQPTDIVGLPVEQKNITTTYFDGLGRTMQTVSTQFSPNNKTDVVTPLTYDEFGRENKKFLPYVSTGTDGSFKLTGLSNQTAFYNSPSSKIINDARSFSETIFEPSPLNRPVQDFGPGQNWKDNNKFVGHSYEVNQANDVLLFIYDPTTGFVSTGSNSQVQFYDAGQLQAKRTTNEHGNDVVEYVDKLGHTICKKVQYKIDTNGNKLYACTYYIYDDLGNLAVVLPPEAIISALSTLTSQN